MHIHEYFYYLMLSMNSFNKQPPSMNVVYITTLVSIVILLHCVISDTRCPADGIVGCECSVIVNAIDCRNEYTGVDIPVFSNSSEFYQWVSHRLYTYIMMYLYVSICNIA